MIEPTRPDRYVTLSGHPIGAGPIATVKTILISSTGNEITSIERGPAGFASDPALDTTESNEDRESVGEIRALLAADSSLSPGARQVRIVARKGRVWLRGQVNTPEERAAIERAARKAANVRDVRNELVVLQ